MAYQQHQYYQQGAPQPGQQPAQYNDPYNQQYDDYGYYHEEYQQWDDGSYEDHRQSGSRGNGYPPQQQQGGYNDMSAPLRQPLPNRRGQPRDQYQQNDMYDERAYQQAQGGDPRGMPPMGANGGPPHGAMERGGSSGRAGGRPPDLRQGQAGLRPPGRERALMSPVSPMTLPQDNAFPAFPSKKAKSPAKPPVKPPARTGSIDEAMAHLSVGHENEGGGRPAQRPQGRGRGNMGPPNQNRGPPPGRGGFGHSDMQRHDSGHSEDYGQYQQPPPSRGHQQQRPSPTNLEGARPTPQRQFNPASPTQRAFGPNTQRSMTLPPNISSAGNARGFNSRDQWQERGPAAGYHGPESPRFNPPRPSTATGTKPSGYGRPPQFEQKSSLPQAPQQHQQHQPHQPPQQEDGGDLDNFYDDYYQEEERNQQAQQPPQPPPQQHKEPQDRTSKATSIDMPNFDAMPENGTQHRRGLSFENHLFPTTSDAAMQSVAPVTAGPADTGVSQNRFYQQASRSRSQPDLHGQYAQGDNAYQMSEDAPPMPGLSAGPAQATPNGLPNGPRGRGPPPRPPRGMTTGSVSTRGLPPNQGYGPGPGAQTFDPRYAQRQPQVQRGYSGESAYSEPGPNAMRMGSPMALGAIPRPGTAAPAPVGMSGDSICRPGTTQPQGIHADSLPAHPVPVRAGLMQQQDQPSPRAQGQTARPPPVRQYHTEPAPVPQQSQKMSSVPPKRRSSVPHPVTHDELNRLRNTWNLNPADSVTGLQLAKKLVEAASVLADEGGTADTRTRNKNREKYVFEAHKTVKKLVAGGSPDAMFYLADCYGQGLLGLQVDPKEAFTLYQSAAKAGHPGSAYRTAVCCEIGYEEGGGTKRDPLRAVQWYRRAAALGDTPAMYKMGMILLKGLLGQQRNLGEAINMLKRAADHADEQNPHALHELALIYEGQTGNERIIQDETYAFSLFRQAAELGYKFSQFRLGQAYEYGLLGCPVDPRSSIGWYTRAAAQEEHQSELALSGWYLTGSQGILEQSDTEAYLWARKAACAEPPLPKALFAMGYFTEVGIGCPRSLEEAKRWYGRAAAYKFPKAQERLEELKRGGVKVQKSRERLSRSNQRQHEENCVVM